MFLSIAASSLHFMIYEPYVAVEFAGIISMIVSAFLFYYSGNTYFSFIEFLGLLILALAFY